MVTLREFVSDCENEEYNEVVAAEPELVVVYKRDGGVSVRWMK